MEIESDAKGEVDIMNTLSREEVGFQCLGNQNREGSPHQDNRAARSPQASDGEWPTLTAKDQAANPSGLQAWIRFCDRDKRTNWNNEHESRGGMPDHWPQKTLLEESQNWEEVTDQNEGVRREGLREESERLPVTTTEEEAEIGRIESSRETEEDFDRGSGENNLTQETSDQLIKEETREDTTVSIQGECLETKRMTNLEDVSMESGENQNLDLSQEETLGTDTDHSIEPLSMVNNPFKTIFSLVLNNDSVLTLGQAVSFEGKGSMSENGGRGPKKKNSLSQKAGTSSSRTKLRNVTNLPESSGEVPLQSKSATEKRRASGEVDPNGCRLSERRDSDLEMLDSVVRECKLHSDGLQQVRQVIRNLEEQQARQDSQENMDL
ncbi:hypothetical protein R1sor_003018 [Riccia sorocarpa]|uniref:Uncharacterized protein n=1 Tax=Riccia sorocarpa TaxID=122646 RepID=A0ABD3H237_9MARC